MGVVGYEEADLALGATVTGAVAGVGHRIGDGLAGLDDVGNQIKLVIGQGARLLAGVAGGGRARSAGGVGTGASSLLRTCSTDEVVAAVEVAILVAR